jgi:hypothetical protein
MFNNHEHAEKIDYKICKDCNIHQSDLNKALSVDHDHKTGKIRGLLCYNCNLALGHTMDNVEILKNLTKYLDESRHESSNLIFINLLKK